MERFLRLWVCDRNDSDARWLYLDLTDLLSAFTEAQAMWAACKQVSPHIALIQLDFHPTSLVEAPSPSTPEEAKVIESYRIVSKCPPSNPSLGLHLPRAVYWVLEGRLIPALTGFEMFFFAADLTPKGEEEEKYVSVQLPPTIFNALRRTSINLGE